MDWMILPGRPDVGTSVASDLRLVANATRRPTNFRPVERAIGAERGLADTRRSDQAEDRALHLAASG
jgi:hypothetical protein